MMARNSVKAATLGGSSSKYSLTVLASEGMFASYLRSGTTGAKPFCRR
jgi:hypothetical protein